MHPPPRPGQSRAPGAHVHPDDAIRQTDDDAAASRLSAASLGYLDDPFASILYRPGLSSSSSSAPGPSSGRKPPLINVGTHHRTAAIDIVVERFLSASHDGAQIVSLGAGSDTRFWRLMSRNAAPSLRRYVEIDFPHLTSPKAQRISRSKKLSTLLSSLSIPNSTASPSTTPTPTSQAFTLSQGGTQLSSSIYHLVPLDLRLPPSSSSSSSSTSTPTSDPTLTSSHLATLLLPYLDPSLPTLFLAECVFCYMQPAQSQSLISWFGSTFPHCAGVIYEMCGLNDAFGAVMRRNLAARHLSLPGAEPFGSTKDQAGRFLDPQLGEGVFQRSGAKSLWEVREKVIPQAELVRISKLEMLDEIEELRLVLGHYCVAWATKGDLLSSVEL